MSRYFVQDYSQTFLESPLKQTRYAGHFHSDNIPRFAIYSAIMMEGFRLYGSTLSPDPDESDDIIIDEWLHSSEKSNLDDRVLKVFEDGRFAPYRKQDQDETNNIRLAIGLHPSLIQVVDTNGYQFDKPDFDAM